MVIALTLLARKETNTRIFAHDTFEEMSKPTEEDWWLSDEIRKVSGIQTKSTLLEWEKE